MQVSAYSQADILILGRLAKLSSTEIWKILSPEDCEQETSTSMILCTHGHIISSGVDFAYYLGQAISRASVE